MNRINRIALILLLVTMTLPAAAAQDDPPKRALPEQGASEKAQPANAVPQKITAVLDRVLEAQKTFADENLRAMIRAHVADVFWSYDQPRARRIFEDTLQTSERLADQDASPTVLGDPVRNQVIRLIMHHDPDWAARLIESRGELITDLQSRRIRRNRDRTVLQLQLALFFLQRDARRAALAAKPFAENGDLNNLMILLGGLRAKDAKAADELFLLALAKTRLGQPTFEDIRRIAPYPFPSFGEGVLRFLSDGSNRGALAAAGSGPEVVQKFLEFSYEVVTKRFDAALTGASGTRLDARSTLDFAIPKLLVPYFDRFLPDRAVAYRARVQEALQGVPAEERQYLALTEPGTIEELLSRAAAVSVPRLKDSLIQRAIRQASSSDFERAAALIERLSNEDARVNARDLLRERVKEQRATEAWSALNDGDLDKAEALAAETSDWRSDGLLVRGVIGRVAQKDKLRAARILDGYEQKATGIAEPHERALRLMQLAGVAANIDLNRGFEKMKQAIAEFNQAGFSPELERYRDSSIGTGGTTPIVSIGLNGLLGNWDLYWLGQTDSDRAVALTQQFQMKEAATIMLLNVCRGALRNVPASR